MIDEALDMLKTFVSVGTTTFDMTITSLSGEKVRYRPGVPAVDLHRTIPSIIVDAEQRAENVILRPHSHHAFFIQLDDLAATTLPRIEPVALLTLETSPGSYQAWVAIKAEEANKNFGLRLRQGTGADPNASGATRIAGSRNFKPKYAPSYPVVTLLAYSPRRITGRSNLEALDLVAKPREQLHVKATMPPRTMSKAWPCYKLSLERAPKKADGTPDRSRADFAFALTALSWGKPPSEVIERLAASSARAPEWRDSYAWMREVERTVVHAAKYARVAQ